MTMNMNNFSEGIFLSRYAFPGETTWEELSHRVSNHIASAEANGDIPIWKDKFFEIIDSGDFIPGGRILNGSGRRDGALLNCFSLGVEDTRESISNLLRDSYLISTKGGGIGVSFSSLRPKGDPIQGVEGVAPGVVSEILMLDSIGEQVRSGGGRRVALLALLSIKHPDILEFIDVKTQHDKLNNHNISVAVTREFIKAVKKDKDWTFEFGSREYKIWEFKRSNSDGRRKEEMLLIPGVTKEKALITAENHWKSHFDDIFEFIGEKKIKAKELWHKIIKNNLESGEPGFIFIDNIEDNFTSGYFNKFACVNPSLRWDTLVQTETGWFPIKSLAEENSTPKILNFNGEWKDSIVFKSGKNKQLYEILFSNGSKTYATAEHKWPILKRGVRTLENMTPHIDYTMWNTTLTKDLKRNDLVFNPAGYPYGNENSLLTEEDGFILGWNYGDGWRGFHKGHKNHNKEYYGFIFSKEDTESGIGERVLSYINSRKKRNSTLRENKGCFEIYVNSKDFVDFFKSLKHKGKKEGLPDSIWSGSKEFIDGFIDGLFSSDGHISIKPPHVCLTTAHFKLAEDVKKLLSCLGISSTLTKAFSTLNGKRFIRYDIKTSVTHSKKFAYKFKLSHKRKQGLLDILKEKEIKNKNGRNYLRIVSSKPTEIYEDVYDITVVDNTHTFRIDNGFTKNCGEVTLEKNGSCCLGSLNLSNFYDEEKNDVNWSKLGKTIKIAVRFLDNVLTVNQYPIPSTKEAAASGRRLGLGTTALAYLLIKMGYKYGSKKSIEFIERLYATIRNEAYEASIELAAEKGAFPKFIIDKHLDNSFIQKLPTRLIRKMKKYGLRNCALLTIPPTGTTSMVAGVSSGIEPIFAPLYLRRFKKDNTVHEELVMDKLFAEYIEQGKDTSAFIGASEITPEEHLGIQVASQEFIDNSISKTVQLPNNFTSEQLEELLLDFTDHLKGVTLYREGSRENTPLQPVDINNFTKEELLATAKKYTISSDENCKSGTCDL